ncbi:MAG: hypothetical protein RLZZ401_2095 [Pseudomonadota bacterium]
MRHLLCLCLLCSAAAQAQNPLSRVADPSAPVPAVAYPAPWLTQPPPSDPSSWVEANQTVGQFPRGHIDLLKWEAGQADALKHPSIATKVAPNAHPHSSKP